MPSSALCMFDYSLSCEAFVYLIPACLAPVGKGQGHRVHAINGMPRKDKSTYGYRSDQDQCDCSHFHQPPVTLSDQLSIYYRGSIYHPDHKVQCWYMENIIT